MAISVVAVGAVANGTGAITPGMPVGRAVSDILLLFIESENEVVTVSGGTETWVQVADSPQGINVAGAADAARLTVFWARNSSTTSTAPTTNVVTDHLLGRMVAYRGVTPAGDPWNVTSGDTVTPATATVTVPGDTTTVDNCLVVFACAGSLPDANSTTEFGAATNASLTAITEEIDNAVNSGTGGSLWVGSGLKAAAGLYSATTCTKGTAATQGRISIALAPALFVDLVGNAANGVSTMSGALSVTHPLAGVSNGVSAMSGTLGVNRGLAGVSNGVSAMSGAFTVNIGFAGVANGVSTMSGSFSVTIGLAGVSSGVSAMSGEFLEPEVFDLICGGGYGGSQYGAAVYAGGVPCSDTEQNFLPAADSIFEITCGGGGYAGSQYAAGVYAGGTPCSGAEIGPGPGPGPDPGPGSGIASNVEEFCINIDC